MKIIQAMRELVRHTVQGVVGPRNPIAAYQNPSYRYREMWRDCCDCIHDAETSSDRCRKCFDDVARPDWVAKWANPRDDRAAHLVRGTVDPVVQIHDSQK